MTKLILVRHCQAEGNLKRYFQGCIDSDITPLGEEQIKRVGLFLKDEPIDVIYVSSKIRAKKTAEGIDRYHGVPMITDDRIVEINAGSWEGVLLTEISEKYPEQFRNWREHPEIFQADGGETMEQVYNRVSAAIMDIVRANPGKTVCAVSHGCAIRNMMCFLHGKPLSEIKSVVLGTNTAVNVIEFDDEFRPTVVIENCIDHLDGLGMAAADSNWGGVSRK